MPILGSTAPARFVRDHWQREPLLVRDALPDLVEPPVDGDTLAGLACEDGVESRIVVHDAAHDTWHCEHGPFDETHFAALPSRGWTLLVQAVDLHLPRVAALREQFGFLPRWRLDDVMVSYAADGGGVGPHFDHYDVFLIQAAGSRRWTLGQRCDASTPLRAHPSLKLVETLEPVAEHVLEAGDMLYLPPGIAHQGTAIGDGCITCSVGFRAPSYGELVQGAAAWLAAALPEGARYRDGEGAIDADPFLINTQALDALARVWDALPRDAMDAALARAFGCQLTEVRHPELAHPGVHYSAEDLVRDLSGRRELRLAHDAASRFAYAPNGAGALLFVDGEAHDSSVALARAVCRGWVRATDLCDDRDRELLLALIGQGSVHPG